MRIYTLCKNGWKDLKKYKRNCDSSVKENSRQLRRSKTGDKKEKTIRTRRA
jgi:hypothetical protein